MHLKTRWTYKLLLGATALLLGAASQAATENECGPNAERIVQSAYPQAHKADDGRYRLDHSIINLPNGTSLSGEPQAMVCRVWPAHPEKMLVAVPLMNEVNRDGYSNNGDLELLVLERDSLKVQQRLRLPRLMDDDAIRIEGIRFDTARYRLSTQDTAFGLNIYTEGDSRANPYEDTTLRLYHIEGEHLAPVLDNVVVAEQSGEWDTTCEGYFNKTKRTIAMATTRHHGLADMLVTETRQHSVSKGDSQNCQTQDEPARIRKFTLTYDGSTYNVPQALQRFGE